ncbi:glyoxalase [Pseudonocardia sp. CNS-004]|nr:glyoxalase [Pseudonocardia sp. CNS-004]
MDYQLEVVVLPVRDVDRSLTFYTERVGFALDVDYRPTHDFRVVQLTPPGSASSIQLVAAATDERPDPERSMYLVVADIEAAHRELQERGVDLGDIRHKSGGERWEGDWEPGVDPQRRDLASFLDFTDPDGNRWVLQERSFPRE